MSGSLDRLLSHYREAAKTEREKGAYFEGLIADFLLNDPTQASQYDEVLSYQDWARGLGLPGQDTGIDLVARLRGSGEYCAVQCKFYEESHTIQKGDIDSFFAASSKSHFARRLFVDTTRGGWGRNAEETLNGQLIETQRLGLDELEKSPIDWSVYQVDRTVRLAPKKQLREHQVRALEAVTEGLTTADRGKLIMACGTGKTFTSLKIAEHMVGAGGSVLYLVPSLGLMSQTIREWSLDAKVPLRSFAACSDVQVGKRKHREDVAEVNIHDLVIPATTDAAKLAREVARAHDSQQMTVVFSTYQSIQVISDAQQRHHMESFDLIICDEAHRTTGATLADESESHFVRVHKDEHVLGRKRLYMTATPRIFGDAAKSKAENLAVELASMDDETQYGKTLHALSFPEAIERELLCDYRVIVLAVDQSKVAASVQRRLADQTTELKMDDATRIVGCYRALSKWDMSQELAADPQPMRRAVAFCKSIVASKMVCREFPLVIEEYLATTEPDQITEDPDREPLICETEHVDGTDNAKRRTAALDWLKGGDDPSRCRILSNARCLSEGVDVPALDAILFLHPRKSQVDVVQAVGRVMRQAPGKRMGYVILPVAIPAGVTPEQALDDNENYRVVWQVLNALRAHDERLDALINKSDLGVDMAEKLLVVAEIDTLPARLSEASEGMDIGGAGGGGDSDETGDDRAQAETQHQYQLFIDEFTQAVIAKIVQKCGSRDYWTDWAADIARIAQDHISRISGLVRQPGTPAHQAFNEFLAELRDDLNDSITEDDTIEMLAQHLITKPVFDALFEDYHFTQRNPVSRALDRVLAVLQTHNLEKESQSLEKFYTSVRNRAAGIDNPAAKQKIVVELYDKFFRTAFRRLTERLGIVYTPVEVVDFILHSVDHLLRQEFGKTLADEGIHIIDPFTGTGTFITRLIQSGLIPAAQLPRKFNEEIHANEIILLAYYIAAVNIEAAYHGAVGGKYTPFPSICLTDTFQLYEKDDLVSNLLVNNSARRTRQKKLALRVIIGNPPYSAGQDSANDNNQNVTYPDLDKRIRDTYAVHSQAANKNALYDSYIRAFRWASDRLAHSEGGIVGFVTGAAWIDRSFADGMRHCLAEEFSSLYIFHLRGDIRKNMLSKGRAGEGQNIFASGSMTGIAISFLVKNPVAAQQGQIFFHDIGDYLDREEKLARINTFASIQGITTRQLWRPITPDAKNDWLDQRDPSFERFMPLGDKKSATTPTIFSNYSSGLKTQRDAWCYNCSRDKLIRNITRTIETYNAEKERYQSHSDKPVDDIIDHDSSKISWTRALKADVRKGKPLSLVDGFPIQSTYRPFQKQWLFYSRRLNEMVYQMPRIFPDATAENRTIAVTGIGARSGFSVLMVDSLPCLDMVEKGQCFPRWLYDQDTPRRGNDLFAGQDTARSRRDAITDEGLAHFQTAYPGHTLSKDDLFYYIYGVLHAPDYRQRYANNLSKQLPRIPAVNSFDHFQAFAQAGRALAELHVNYEIVAPYPVTFKQGDPRTWVINDPVAFYRVSKMKFAGKAGEKDKTTIIYNANITLTNIPLEAYDYIVNGKPAIEWVMERQAVKTDKASGIVNDANDYANETLNDPSYPLTLLTRVITVSLETQKIISGLPKLEM